MGKGLGEVGKKEQRRHGQLETQGCGPRQAPAPAPAPAPIGRPSNSTGGEAQ